MLQRCLIVEKVRMEEGNLHLDSGAKRSGRPQRSRQLLPFSWSLEASRPSPVSGDSLGRKIRSLNLVN